MSEAMGEIQNGIDRLMMDIRMERLEAAIPLVEAMAEAYALERDLGSVQPGALSVRGWMTLISRWERILSELTPRKLIYFKDFFNDMLMRHQDRSSPISFALQGLMDCLGQVQAEKELEAA
ncbi:MAG: hypothetical protein HQL50_14090 [Magnetococcales bacterium]|nr:hypothetical protein [Magnetococcales bacterium]